VRRFLGERRRGERSLRERATKLLQRTVRRFLAKRRFCGWGNLAFQELGESWLDEDEGTFGGLIYEGTEMRWVGAGSDAEASVSSNDSTEEESGGAGLECAGGGGGYTEDSVPYLVVGGGVEGGKPWWAVVSCWSKWSKYYQRTEISNEDSYWGMCPPEAWEHFARPEDMVATIGIGKAAEIALGKIGGCLAFQEELPQIVCREASAVKRILEGSVFDTPENIGNPNGHARANDWIAWSASWVERMGQRWIDEGRGEAPVIVHGPRALGPLFRQASSRKGISKHAHLMNPDAVAYLTGKDYASWRDVLDEFEYGDPLFSSKKMEKSRIKEHLGWLMTVDDSGTAARVGIPERLYLATHHNGWWQPGLQRIKPSNYCAKYPECPDEEEAARALSAEQAYFEAVEEVLAAILLVGGPTVAKANLRRAVAAEEHLVRARLSLASQLPWMKSPSKFYRKVEAELADILDMAMEVSPQYEEKILTVSVDDRWPLGRIIAEEFTGEWAVKCVMRDARIGLLDANEAAWYANVSRYELVEGEGRWDDGSRGPEGKDEDQGSDVSPERVEASPHEDCGSHGHGGVREALGREGEGPSSPSKDMGAPTSTIGVATDGVVEGSTGEEGGEGNTPGDGGSQQARGAEEAMASNLINSPGRRSGGGS
jgi:hypothetical protein